MTDKSMDRILAPLVTAVRAAESGDAAAFAAARRTALGLHTAGMLVILGAWAMGVGLAGLGHAATGAGLAAVS